MLGLAWCAHTGDNVKEYELLCREGMVATKREVQAVLCPCQAYCGAVVVVATLEVIWLSFCDDRIYRCSCITSSTERSSFWV